MLTTTPATVTPREALDLIISANKLTARQAAKDIATSQVQLWRWRSGRGTPSAKWRQRLAVWSEGKIPADVDWNEPMTIPIPGPVPQPEQHLCWTVPPRGTGIERLRADLRLPSLVSVASVAKKLGVTGLDGVNEYFRQTGYYVLPEQRPWREHAIMIHVPMVPIVPAMRPDLTNAVRS